MMFLSLSNAGAGGGMQDMDVVGMFTMCVGIGVVLGAMCGVSAALLALQFIPSGDARK
jgi:hypothetical protein